VLREHGVTALDHIELIDEAMIAAQIGEMAGWRDMGIRMGERARTLAPRESGTLADSMEVRFQFGPDPKIMVGSTHAVSGGLNLMALMTLGTEPHDIPNAFGWGPTFGIGGRFSGKFHPGTKKNPWVMQSIQQIVHEMAGISLAAIGGQARD
jgi:hypothetical protein